MSNKYALGWRRPLEETEIMSHAGEPYIFEELRVAQKVLEALKKVSNNIDDAEVIEIRLETK